MNIPLDIDPRSSDIIKSKGDEDMNGQPLYDITDVCNMLGVTSRALRFYEEKSIIQSTKLTNSSRRKYTEKQLSLIRNVLVLRTLGLSVKTIAELQKQETDLHEAVLSKRAEIYAQINARLREINLLNEAISVLESSDNIFRKDWGFSSEVQEKYIETAKICTQAILEGNHDILYQNLGPRLTQYMPMESYIAVRADTLAPLGEFVSFDRITVDKPSPNKIYSFVKFSKMGFRITFVFHNAKIEGLWLSYYDASTR